MTLLQISFSPLRVTVGITRNCFLLALFPRRFSGNTKNILCLMAKDGHGEALCWKLCVRVLTMLVDRNELRRDPGRM